METSTSLPPFVTSVYRRIQKDRVEHQTSYHENLTRWLAAMALRLEWSEARFKPPRQEWFRSAIYRILSREGQCDLFYRCSGKDMDASAFVDPPFAAAVEGAVQYLEQEMNRD